MNFKQATKYNVLIAFEKKIYVKNDTEHIIL